MTENISTRATQKYSTVEDLAQEPSIISSLEVLQTLRNGTCMCTNCS